MLLLYLGLGGVLAGLIIGIIIGIPMLIIRLWLNAKNMPSDEEKKDILRQIEKMKEENLNYTERCRRLESMGFRRDVAEQLLAESEKVNRKKQTRK